MAAMGRINFSYFEYGPEVTLIAPEVERYYFVQVPISGTLHLSIGGREAVLRPGQVTMLNPFRGVRLGWSKSAQLVVRIDRRLMDAAVARHLPGYDGPCIDFEETTVPSVAQTQGVRDLIWLICRQIEHCNSPMMQPSTQQHLTGLLLETILYTFPHNLRDRLCPRLPLVVPGYVKRVEAFIHANAHRTVRLQDLVKVAGVSERSLQYGFRRFRGAGPMQVLKAVRLDRVRRDLLNKAEGRNSITDIALKWGFVHHGNFARDYRRRFGENPAETRAASC
jgi:AraC-like DNA-binding protein